MKQIIKVTLILGSLLAFISLGSRICATEAAGEKGADEPDAASLDEESVVSLSVYTPPNKREYTAFEEFCCEGLTLLAAYSDGRSAIIKEGEYEIIYPTAQNLRYGDTSVLASYSGKSTRVEVSVKKAEYDLTTFVFKNSTVTYDGQNKIIKPEGSLPIGLDGIPLSYTHTGGGRSVGNYRVVITFFTDSKNYELPPMVEVTLEIIPFEATVKFENTEFTYDGDKKCPSAYYCDVYGRKISLSVDGGRSYAGEYTAVASGDDPNYRLLGSTVRYKINKANYDLSTVSWSESDFTYDGAVKEVYIEGLPEGAFVLGYSDNKASLAGKYTATVTLSYDEVNYNRPEIPPCEWEIKKADYSLSDFCFLDTKPTFSGKINYPELSGTLPVGADGIALGYRFLSGATHVSEGRTKVEIAYFTESKNYNLPENTFAYVEVVPLGITVLWEGLSHTYDASEKSPVASSEYTELSVIGKGKNAGKYTAVATSLDGDYHVINSEVEYEIKRAENTFFEKPEILDFYAGKEPKKSGKALGGEVIFVYYTESGERLSEYPKAAGKYYAIAECDGGENYLPISSEKIPFSVIAITPVSIFVRLHKTTFYAFERLESEDFTLYYKNNDGSEAEALIEPTILYEGGESFLFGNKSATVIAGELSTEISVTVIKADYDMSGVFWSEGDFVYDGSEKQVVLSGLPDGVFVSEYFQNSATCAGEYTASAALLYDVENYNPPIVESYTFRIRKATVALPIFESLTYNGKEQAPAHESSLYKIDLLRGTNAGKYAVSLTLLDGQNYEFESGGNSAETYYEILPRTLLLTLSRVDKYLFSRTEAPSYTVSNGELIPGDDLKLSFVYHKASVECISKNPNYSISFVGGELVRHSYPNKSTVFLLSLILLSLVALILITLVLCLRKRKIKHYFAALRCRLSPIAREVLALPSPKPQSEMTCETVEEKIEKEEITEADITIPLDVERADLLLSDALAKELLHKNSVVIETEGKKKRVINVDTLNEFFSAGDKIDVNTLKEMNLVPYDTAYVKVLARGVIDKSLTVYANDFSLSAVKMIALTGGEAVKVITVKKKKNDENS